MIILGIDPGTIFLGYCIYDSVTDQVIKSGAIHTKKWRDKNIITFLQRSRIFIHGLIKKYQVEQCCLERTFTFRNSLYISLLVVMTDVMKEAAGELVPSSTIQVTR
jgi:Holliday junction resolvasome RuvABC endonuclease subunit